MLVRLSSSILGIFWLPLGAIAIIVGILAFIWFRLPCYLDQPICQTILTTVVQQWLFGQVYQEDILTAVLFVSIIAVLIGLLWSVVGSQLLRYGLTRQNPHAPAYGFSLVVLTVGVLFFTAWLLDNAARPWLTQQQQNITTQLPTENPDSTPNLAGETLDLQLIRLTTYTQVVNIAQTITYTAAIVFGFVGLGLLRPYPEFPITPSAPNQCETCGLMGDSERPRCILCHAPLSITLTEAEALTIAPPKSFTVTLQLAPEAENGLPVRNPQVQIKMPRRFTVKSVESIDDKTRWIIKERNTEPRLILHGPAYITGVIVLTLEVGVTPRFSLLNQHHNLQFNAIATQTITDMDTLKVILTRNRPIETAFSRILQIPRNLLLIWRGFYTQLRALLYRLSQPVRWLIAQLARIPWGWTRTVWSSIKNGGMWIRQTTTEGAKWFFAAAQNGTTALKTRLDDWRRRP